MRTVPESQSMRNAHTQLVYELSLITK